jgi:hypothetical protein
MRIKKEYAVLAAVIVALSLYLALRSKDRTHYSLPEVTAPDRETIGRIVFSHGVSSVVLERSGDEWRIKPEGFKADKGSVDRMLDAIAGFSIGALVAESGNYALYDLEGDKRIKLEAYSGADVALAVDIGKTAPTRMHTFVRLEGRDGIYQAAGNIRNTFETDAAKLRDKTAVSFDAGEVTGINIVSGDGSIDLAKSLPVRAQGAENDSLPPAAEASGAAPAAIWITADSREADSRAVDQILNSLSNLMCESYLEGRAAEDLGVPVYTVMVRAAQTVTLSIYAMEGEKYPAVSSQNEYPFLLPKWRGDQIMKRPSDLLKNEAD